MDDLYYCYIIRFTELLRQYSLHQYILEHCAGQVIDTVLAREYDTLVNFLLIQDCDNSDYQLVTTPLSFVERTVGSHVTM